ncbi:MAG: DUF3276 family protein [Saprospiraceae bacterium]|nr:DUF3276 family protein [Saprospiraceae bacterium]
MENEKFNQKAENVFSSKVKAGKRRTYFFDIRQTKGSDYFLTLTESTKRFNGDGYERHKLFLYKEDINRFVEGLEEAVRYFKEELMPDYDFDEYTKRQEEWEARKALEDAENGDGDAKRPPTNEEDIAW